MENSKVQIEKEKQKIIGKNRMRSAKVLATESSTTSEAETGNEINSFPALVARLQAAGATQSGITEPEIPDRERVAPTRFSIKNVASSKLNKWKKWINVKMAADQPTQATEDPIENASKGIQHAEKVIVSMDEGLVEESECLAERALKLRRQSADAFQLMQDVKRFQQ